MAIILERIGLTKQSICVLFLLASIVASFTTISHAENDYDRCGSIVDDDERLDCYDAIPQSDTFTDIESGSISSEDAPTPIQSRQQQEQSALTNWFSITPHRPNYFLPVSYNASADFSEYGEFGDLFKSTEIKYQLSLKTQIWPSMWLGSSLWAAYTQVSYWQLYADEEASAPFRETNHEPEIFWELPINYPLLGFDMRVFTLAFNHQSNGRSEPLSRSWNRLTAQLVFEKNRFVISMKPWIRVDTSSNDDNPNVENYMGRILFGAAYKGDTHTIAVGLKNNLKRDNLSGIEIDWTFPLVQRLKGLVQLYFGYGENLIDMENYANRISVGFALTDWL